MSPLLVPWRTPAAFGHASCCVRRMYETPQTFASKAAIIEVLKRASGAQLTRDELLDAAARDLDVSAAEVTRALNELQLEDHVASVVIDGEERIQFAPAAH